METSKPVAARPYVWQMIKEAVENLSGRATYGEIKDYIRKKWNDVNENTISAQIIVSTVNQPSRIHYPENKKPRISSSQYDFLYSTGRGQVVSYNPEEHGIWEIYENETGALQIRQQALGEELQIEDELHLGDEKLIFPIEAHLRDFLARNLRTVRGLDLRLFVDDMQRDGKEYPTGVGPIDILAVDRQGNYYVFELKLERGPDRALGQILRYMGWVKKELANGKAVKGIIIANKIDEKLKYAVSVTPDVLVYEYELKFDITQSGLA